MNLEGEAQRDLDVKVYTMNRVFDAASRKSRVDNYVDRIYVDSKENRKIRKAYRNQLMEIMKDENEAIKVALRIIQKKKPGKGRKKRTYVPTPYVEFCREMRTKYSHTKLAGKIQQLWRERRDGKAVVEEPVVKEEPVEESKKQEFNPKAEKERYLQGMSALSKLPWSESDTDSD